jgi:amino acid permease
VQCTLSLAIGPVLLVFAAQLAQAAALLYCPPAGTAGESAVCSVFTSYNKCAILLGVLMAVLSQAPSHAAVESLTVFFSLCSVFYVGVSVALLYTSGLPPPDFGLPPGSTSTRAFSALNAVGILIFAFGDSIQPEVQATMRPYPPRGRTEAAMRKAVSLAYALFTAVYFLVAATGYAAYGNAAPGNLLLVEGSPRGLVVTAQALSSVQVRRLRVLLHAFWSSIVGTVPLARCCVRLPPTLPRRS